MKRYILLSTILSVFAYVVPVTAGQFTISIPKLADIVKKDKGQPKPDAVKTAESSDARSGPADAGSNQNDCSDAVLEYHHLKELKDALEEVRSFTPDRGYFVSERSDRKNEFFEAAMLPWKRTEYFENYKNIKNFEQCTRPVLDQLATEAKKKLPSYPGPAGYNSGTPAEKRLLLGKINDIADGKVLRVGIKQPNWLISTNSYGLPTARYRHGMILAKYPKLPDGICWVFFVNLKQDYAGGGTYGASYGYFISRALAGCPAA